MAAIDDAKTAVLNAMKKSGEVSMYGALPAAALKRGHTNTQTNNEESLVAGGAASAAIASNASAVVAAGALVDQLKLYFDTLYTALP